MSISKELLSEVLAQPTKIDIYSIEKYNNNALIYKWKSSIDNSEVTAVINIYELAHKCKQWALKSKLNILLTVEFRIEDVLVRLIRYDLDEYFTAQSEPEAVFKATSYVMEQLKEKD